MFWIVSERIKMTEKINYGDQLGLFKKEDAIKEWQKGGNTHPMTCGKCENKDPLVPFIVLPEDKNIGISLGTQSNAKVMVKCKSCGHVQEDIPDCIYQWFLSEHMSHKILFGQLVEVEIDNGSQYQSDSGVVCTSIKGTFHLFVIGYMRDCDGEPLYIVGDIPVKYQNTGSSISDSIYYKRFCTYVSLGHGEKSLTVLDVPLVKMYNTMNEYLEIDI